MQDCVEPSLVSGGFGFGDLLPGGQLPEMVADIAFRIKLVQVFLCNQHIHQTVGRGCLFAGIRGGCETDKVCASQGKCGQQDAQCQRKDGLMLHVLPPEYR